MDSSGPVRILFGGSSSERFVSVASAQNVSRLLPSAEPWFLAKEGPVFRVAPAVLAAHQDPFQQPFTPPGAPAWPSLTAALDSPEARGACFFLALHGGDGENGTVQTLLEQRQLAFTGSGARASADAFDKARAKALAGAHGARLAAAHLLEPMSAAEGERALSGLLDEKPRWVLKPVADGSSYGLIHLRERAQVPHAAAELAKLGLRYLAEEFIDGRELTVGVVDGASGPTALPVSEVRLVPGGAFDYAGKYLGKGTEELTPAPLDEAPRLQAQALAVLAHRAVGCAGYTRTDMILTADGPVFLEINTLPGLTKASFIPQQLACAGLDLAEFLRGQVAWARARAQGR